MPPQAAPDSTAAHLDGKLEGSPMEGTGAAFVAAGQAHQVNPYFLFAIARHESNLGRLGFARNGSNNPFGLGVTGAPGAGMRFPSWEASITRAAATLAGPLYAQAGLVTIAQIGSRWAADPLWSIKVAAAMQSARDGIPTPTSLTVLGPDSFLGAGPPGSGDLSDALPDVFGGVGDALGALVDLVRALLSPKWWIRVGMVVSGVVALALGLRMIGRAVADSPDRG